MPFTATTAEVRPPHAISRYVYRPLEAVPTVTDGLLGLTLRDPGWLPSRRLDDFVPDHGHLMHLFVVSLELDRLRHLHPRQNPTGTFEQRLPDLPAGRYELFGDLVHKTGVSETVTASLETAGSGGPLSGDDSAFPSPSAGRIVWVRDERPLVTKRLTMFTFRVEDSAGQPARDLELYMGMPGHAVFIRRDRQVFAHVHPWGSAPMAAMVDRGAVRRLARPSGCRASRHGFFSVWISRTRRLQDLRAGQTRRSCRDRGVRRPRRVSSSGALHSSVVTIRQIRTKALVETRIEHADSYGAQRLEEGEDVILSPRPTDWGPYLDTGPVASDAFMENVEDLPVQEREP